MAGSNSTVKVTFLGDVRSLAKASKEASAEVEKVGSAGKRAHAAVTAAAVGMGAAAVAFGKKSIDAFQGVGKETLKLQRSIGGTAEEASRLRFAAEETGTDIDVFTKGVGLLSKNLVGATDKTKLLTRHVEVATGTWKKQTTIVKDSAGHFQKIEKMVPVMKMTTLSTAVKVVNPLIAQLGINVRDTTGHIRPMTELLPEIAEKFKNMPAGAEKTALAMKLFGKNGVAMLPFLNRGAEGIKDLEKESDKLGNTLSGKDLQAVKDNTKAKREWHAAIQGVQIQLGRNLFPILTKGATILAKVAAFVGRNGAVMKPLIIMVSALVVGFKAWTMALAAWNAVMDANPIALVVIGVAALAAGLIYAYKHSQKFRDIVNGAFHVVAVAVDFVKDHWKAFATAFAFLLGGPIIGSIVLLVTHFNTVKQVAVSVFKAIGDAGSFMWNNVLKPTFKFLVDSFLMVAGTIVHGAASAFGWVPGIGGKLKAAAKEFDKFRDSVNATIDGVTKTLKIKVDLDASKLKAAIAKHPALNTPANRDIILGRYAKGGRPQVGGLALVGETGPELFVPDQPGTILTHKQTTAALSGGGGLHIHGDVVVNGSHDKDAGTSVVRSLRNLSFTMGAA